MTRKLRLTALEPRIMLDAAAATTVADQAAEAAEAEAAASHHAVEHDAAAPESGEAAGVEAGAGEGRIVIVADSRSADLDLLLQATGHDVEVYFVRPDESGISRIAEALGQGGDVRALHIVSHGVEGAITLGSDRVTAAGLANGQGQGVAGWSAGLTAAADILLYGCDVAAGPEGALLVQRLAALTGADIAASSDTTGAAALGGDWDLEVTAGSVETDTSLVAGLLATWDGILTTAPTVADPATATRQTPQNTNLTISGVSLADPEGGTIAVTIRTTNESGSATSGSQLGDLSLSQTTGLTFTTGDGTDDSLMTFSGSLVDVNAALNNMVYTPQGGASGAFRIAIEATDADNNTGTQNVGVIVSTAPTVEDTALQIRATAEDTGLAVTGVSVADAEGGILTVTLRATDAAGTAAAGTQVGSLTLAQTTGLTFATGDGTTDSLLVFSGSAADINAALNGMTYAPLANGNGTYRIGMSVQDPAGLTATHEVQVQVAPVNDAPSLATPALASPAVAQVAEGAGNAVTLTAAHFGIDSTSTATLGAFDPDLDPALSQVVQQTANQLTFEVTSLPADGRLYRGTAPLLTGSLFTLQQLIDGQIRYEHGGGQANEAITAGSESDSFNVTIRDGAGGVDTGTVNVRINPANQAPSPSIGVGVTAYEGRTGVPIAVSVTDPDQASGTWQLVFDNLELRGGTLYLETGANSVYDAGTDTLIANGYTYTGTLAALNSQLRFDVSPNEPTAAVQLRITARDDDGGSNDGATTPADGLTGQATVTIPVVENNDNPILTTNAGANAAAPLLATLTHGRITVTGAMLAVTDVDSPANTITYTLTQGVTRTGGNGTAELQLNNQSLAIGSTFTQDDLDNGRVQLVYTGTDDTGAHDFQFGFSIRDGEITAFSLRTQTLSPIDGGTRNDADTAYLNHTNSAGLSNGNLLHQFNVRFQEPNTTNAGATGGGPAATAPGGSAGVNAAPSITVVGITTSDLSEGGTVTIAGTGTTGPRIIVTDPDNTPEEITFRLEQLPDGGQIRLNGTALPLYGTFTLAQLQAGNVSFRHSGGERFLDSSLGFTFSVSDGANAVTPAIDGNGHNFSVEATPVNDTPTLSQSGGSGIVVEGGTITFNTTGQPGFSVSDVDGSGDAAPGALDTFQSNVGTDESFVTIVDLPDHGQLRYNGVALALNATLLRSQVQSNLFAYVHDGSENFADSFQMTVNDAQGQPNSVGNTLTVNIQIAPVNDTPAIDASTPDNPPSNTLNSGLRITEGGSGTIGGSNAALAGLGTSFGGNEDGTAVAQLVAFDPDNSATQLQYRILTSVTQGRLLLNGNALGQNSTFTQDDLDNGRLVYQHFGGPTAGLGNVTDRFQFQVGDAGPGTYPTGWFDIEIDPPANDPPTVAVPSARVTIDDAAAANNPIAGVSVADPDVGDGVSNDALQVTLRLLDGTTPFANAAAYANYTITSGTIPGGLTVDGTNGYVVLRGTLADVNAYLAGLQFGSAIDLDGTLRLEVIVDDRSRNGAGVLTPDPGFDANGGNQNQGTTIGAAPFAVNGTEFNPFADTVAGHPAQPANLASGTIELRISTEDDPPVPSAPATATVTEDVTQRITGFGVVDSESSAFGLNVSATVSVPTGQGTVRLVGSLSGVSVSGNGSNSVTLTGTATAINAALANGVDYTSPSNDHRDRNAAAAGDVTLTLSVNEAGAAIGNETSGGGSPGATAQTATTAITVLAANDAPTVANAGGTVIIGNGGENTPQAITGFSIADPDIDGTDPDGGVSGEETNFAQVTVRLLDGSNAPITSYTGVVFDIDGSVAEGAGFEIDDTRNGTGTVLQMRGTLANLNTALANLRLTVGATLGDSDATFEVQVLVDDRVRSLSSGALDASGSDANGGEQNNSNGSASATAVPTTEPDVVTASTATLTGLFNVAAASRNIQLSTVNTPPTIAAIPTQAAVEDARSYIGGSFDLGDTEAESFNLPVRVTLSTNGNGILDIARNQTDTSRNNVTIVNDRTGVVTLQGTIANIEAMLNNTSSSRGVFYIGDSNVNADQNGAADGDVTITVTINEFQAATNFGFTAQEATRSFGVTIAPRNDAPTLAATGTTATATESTATGTGTPAVQFLSGVTVGDLDLTTTDTLTATNFGRGYLNVAIAGAGADEQLTVAGTLPAGMTIDGTRTGANGAELRILFDADTTLAEVNALVEALRYQTTSDTRSGARTITVTLNDGNNVADAASGAATYDGTNDAGGTGSALGALEASITATVTVVEQNDPPSGGDQTVTTNEDAAFTFTAAHFNYSQPGGETDTLDGVRIDSLPATGTLRLNGVAVTAGQTITQAQLTGGQLTFDPLANQSASPYATFTFSVRDSRGAFDTAPNTMTVNVLPLNDAPTLAATGTTATATESATPNEGTPAVAFVTGATSGDLDLATTAGLTAGTLGQGYLNVAIAGAGADEQLTVAGTLPAGMTIDGTRTGANGAELRILFDADTTLAEVNALVEALRYQTTSDTRSGARTITVTLNDGNNLDPQGDTAGGPAALQASLTATVTVAETNDPPSGGDRTVTTNEDTAFVFTAAHFNYSQPGGETDTLGAVRIDTLPAAGTLRLNGVALTAGSSVTAAQIAAGQLTFLPATHANASPYASFTFSVQDSRGAFDTAPNTMTVNVLPVNDAPVIAGTAQTPSFVVQTGYTGTPAGGAQALLTGAGASDIDILNDADVDSFGGGTITVSLDDYGAGDVLSVDGALTGIASVTGGTGAALVIALNGDATPANVATILNAIRYANTAGDPRVGDATGSSAQRAWSIVLNDGNNTDVAGAVDGTEDAGGDGAGNANTLNSNTLSGTIDFRLPPTATNNIYATAGGSVTVTGNVRTDNTGAGVDSDTEDAIGALTVTQISRGVTDVAVGAGGATIAGQYGSLTIAQDGSFTYTVDPATLASGTPTVNELFVYRLTDTDSTHDTANLRFNIDVNQPAAITAGNVTVTEGGASLVLNAGNANIAVADPDDGGASTLSATVAVSQGTITAVGGAGGTIAGLNSATVTISGATEAQLNSRLQALTVTFPDLDGAGAATAADFTGSLTVTVTVNDGGNVGLRPGTLTGDTNDATANPGDYQYAAGGTDNRLVTIRTLTVTATPLNDAPTLAATGTTATATESGNPNEGTPAVAFVTGATSGDLDLATTAGLTAGTLGQGYLNVAIAGAGADEQLTVAGTLPAGMTIDGTRTGANGAELRILFDADTTLAEVNALVEALRYQTTSDTRSGARTITVTLNDGNNLDPQGDTAGGPAALQASLTATVTVAETNDPPSGGDRTVTTNEDTAFVFTAAHFNYSQPGGETDTLGAVRIDTLPAAGTLRLNGVALTAGSSVTAAQIAAGQLTFLPATHANASPYASFTFSVQDSRGAFDTAPNTMTVNVLPVNDAPVIAGTANNPVLPIRGDGGGTLGQGALVRAGTAAVSDIDIATDADVTGFGGGTLVVSFTAGALAGDTLSLTGTPPGVLSTAGGADGAALSIALTNDATPSQVAAILEAIRYSSTAADPTNGGANATRAWQIVLNDGNNSGDGATGAAATDGTNDAGGPAALASNLLTGTIGFGLPPTATNNVYATVGGGVTIAGNAISDNTGAGVDSDPEDALAALRLTQISRGGMDVAVAAGTPGTIAGQFGSLTVNHDGSFTYTVDPATLASGTPAVSDVFTYRLTDTTNTHATATLTVNIDVNQPAAVSASDVVVTEGVTTILLDAGNANIAVADSDDAGGTLSATVSLSDGASFAAVGGTGGTVSGLGTNTLSFTGITEAELNARLKALTVAVPDPDGGGPVASSDYSGAFQVTVTVNDAGNTGVRPGTLTGDTNDASANPGDYGYAGGGTDNRLVTVRTFTVTVTPVNDAPVIAGTSTTPQIPIAGDGSGTARSETLLSAASASDIDIAADADVSTFGGGSLVVRLTQGGAESYRAGDRLSVDAGLPGVASVTGGSGGALTIALTNGATPAQVAAIMQAIRYGSVDADPTFGGTAPSRTFTVQLIDGNNNGDGGANDGVNDAGGPAALASNLLTGTIGFRLPPTATDNGGTLTKTTASIGGNLISDNDGSGVDSDREDAVAALRISAVGGTAVVPGGSTVVGTFGTLTIDPDGSYTYALDRSNPAVAALQAGAPNLTESFTYTLRDTDGTTDTARLTIVVTGENTSPTARDNTNQVKRLDPPAVGNLVSGNDGLGIDSDPEGDVLTVSDVAGAGDPAPGAPLTVQGRFGRLTVADDGGYSYDLDDTNAEVRALRPGATLSDSFTYAVSDGRGGSANATLRITIDPGPPDLAPPPPSPPAPPAVFRPGSAGGVTQNSLGGLEGTGEGGGAGAFGDPNLQNRLRGIIPGFFTDSLDALQQPLTNPVELTVALQDRVLGQGLQSFAIPASAFRHTDPAETLAVEATLPDGGPLPFYILFDSESGTFTVNTEIPRDLGVLSIDIRVAGRDSEGNEAASVFTVNFTEGGLGTDDLALPPQEGPPQTGQGQPGADGQDANGLSGEPTEGAPQANPQDAEAADPDQDAQAPDPASPDPASPDPASPDPAVNDAQRAEARPDTQQQLQGAGRQAQLTQRDALLNDLLAMFDKVA